MNKITLYREIYKNMGWEYVQYRVFLAVRQKLGLRKKNYPSNPKPQKFLSLSEWKNLPVNFFFEKKKEVDLTKNPTPIIEYEFESFLSGKLSFFNATKLKIGRNFDWLTNPNNGYKYDIDKHWTEVADLSEKAGDIKFVWEKSRFSYLYDLIRHDYHFNNDNSELVFSEMESWIDANPINMGPNYKCSQETSLRVLNWTFALYYFKDSLTEKFFQKVMHSIYWQIKHVRSNINFSRKSVRNNHAITEVLMLYLGGLLFPFFPEAKEWKKVGKKWFEEEITYQVYEDGTFLQFSHNYHRVLIQLLTWALYLSKANGEKFAKVVYVRSKKTLNYLIQCMDFDNGMLPNYGANDGALFFKLNNQNYRDYRPQVNALHYYLYGTHLFDVVDVQEDTNWYWGGEVEKKKQIHQTVLNSFKDGGYYTIRDKDSFTFIKCGSYKDRPSHADNLHIDIWYKGVNVIRDAGTYKYNTTQKLVKYFNGTKAHNTITLGDYDQMQKGPRFIWLKWSEAIYAKLQEQKDKYVFEGKIHAFKHVGKDIFHTRKVEKKKNIAEWTIIDSVQHDIDLPIHQYWNISPVFEQLFNIEAHDDSGKILGKEYKEGWYSGYYGVKEKTKVIVFSTNKKQIITRITLK